MASCSRKPEPADLASRGVQLKALDAKLWHEGPSFLRQHKHTWPVHNVSSDVPYDNPEVKKMNAVVPCIVAAVHLIEKICNHFSRWHKVKRTVTWLLKIRTFLMIRPARHVAQLSVNIYLTIFL